MEYTEVKKQMTQLVSAYASEFNFKIGKFDAGGFTLVQTTELLSLKVGLGMYDRADGYEFAGGYEQIQFVEVEKIIFPVILKHKLWDTATEPTEMSTTFGNQTSDERSRKLSIDLSTVLIDNENDIVLYVEKLQNYLENVAFPWFEKVSQLEAVNEFINGVGMQDILNSFAGPFPTQFYRAMLITERCGNQTRTLEIRDECLRRFEDCKTDGFYTEEMITSYYSSLTDLCGELGI